VRAVASAVCNHSLHACCCKCRSAGQLSQVADRLNAQGVPCHLITGQEVRLVEGAKHVACTVEMADLDQQVEVSLMVCVLQARQDGCCEGVMGPAAVRWGIAPVAWLLLFWSAVGGWVERGGWVEAARLLAMLDLHGRLMSHQLQCLVCCTSSPVVCPVVWTVKCLGA
jgi:hypothetical protein